MTRTNALLGLLLLVAPCAAFAARQGSILFYPTVLKTGQNLLAQSSWREPDRKNAPHVVVAKGVGGPRDARAVALSMSNDSAEYAYWTAKAKGVRMDRTYLFGAWAKVKTANILCWLNGPSVDNGSAVGARVYRFSGCNPELRRYLDDDIRRRLEGDPGEWLLIARTFSLPVAVVGDSLSASFGFYRSSGEATFAEPFLIDVTEAPQTLEVELHGVKPVKKLLVMLCETRDPEWRREFDAPVTEFSATLPAESRAFHGMAADPMSGHALVVTYADGTEDRVACPSDGLFLSR